MSENPQDDTAHAQPELAATVPDPGQDATATASEVVLNPEIKLPPAAFRLTKLELDPQGNPYYKFPPFLSAPEGVKLVPFDEFKPVGIQVLIDPDEVECDGAGIPTVMLNSKHLVVGDADKKRKRRKKRDDEDGSGLMKEPRKPSMWWEDWEEGEDLRTAKAEDPAVPRSERFENGAVEFARGRKLTSITQSVYDKFKFFVGLISHPRGPRFGKRSRQNDRERQQQQQQQDVDSDSDDEDEFDAEAKQDGHEETTASNNVNGQPEPSDDPDGDFYMQEVVAEIERRETRMNNFLNNPERMMQIFFSSWYKDKGLVWDKRKCRDGPKLLEFFFLFFIRNKLMPDYKREFEAALRVCSLAAIELPLFYVFGTPGKISAASVLVWGSRDQPYSIGNWTVPPKPEPEPKSESETPVDPDNYVDPEDINEVENALHGEPGVRLKQLQPVGEWTDWTSGGEFSTPWGAPEGEQKDGDQADAPAWNGELFKPPVPHDLESVWAAPKPVTFLDIFNGPTSVPFKFTPTLTEKSTRYITEIIPADPNAPPASIKATFGVMRMAPWKIPEGSKDIFPPEITKREGGRVPGKPEGEADDPRTEVISVLVDKDEVGNLKIGMGSFGVWVRVNVMPQEKKEEGGERKPREKRKEKNGEEKNGEEKKAEEKKVEEKGGEKNGKREDESDDIVAAVKEINAAKKKKKRKPKPKEDPIEREWWYHEANFETMTSFYVEPNEEETVEGS